MLAFVDESGDSGRKISQGSSRFFVVAVVVFDDRDEALACDQRMSDLRDELGLSSRFEFHFSHNSDRVKAAMLSAVSRFDFTYHVFVLDKASPRLTGPGFAHKDSLYKWTARTAFQNARDYLDSATVVIDQCDDRKFQKELAAYLRRRANQEAGRRIIDKVKVQRSDGNNLLQLADYVAGIATRVASGEPRGQRWRAQYLTRHEKSFRVWP